MLEKNHEFGLALEFCCHISWQKPSNLLLPLILPGESVGLLLVSTQASNTVHGYLF